MRSASAATCVRRRPFARRWRASPACRRQSRACRGRASRSPRRGRSSRAGRSPDAASGTVGAQREREQQAGLERLAAGQGPHAAQAVGVGVIDDEEVALAVGELELAAAELGQPSGRMDERVEAAARATRGTCRSATGRRASRDLLLGSSARSSWSAHSRAWARRSEIRGSVGCGPGSTRWRPRPARCRSARRAARRRCARRARVSSSFVASSRVCVCGCDRFLRARQRRGAGGGLRARPLEQHRPSRSARPALSGDSRGAEREQRVAGRAQALPGRGVLAGQRRDGVLGVGPRAARDSQCRVGGLRGVGEGVKLGQLRVRLVVVGRVGERDRQFAQGARSSASRSARARSRPR